MLVSATTQAETDAALKYLDVVKKPHSAMKKKAASYITSPVANNTDDPGYVQASFDPYTPRARSDVSPFY